MKKLLILTAVFVASIAANAASFKWSTTGTIYDSTGATAMTSFTAYMYSTSDISQSALLASLRAGEALDTSAAITSYSASGSAKIAATTFETSAVSAGDTLNAYFVIVDGDNVFISKDVAAIAQATSTTTMSFASQSTASATLFGDADYTTPGWYSTAAVPEPTSGLLMLLGMAGLALRRRRA